MRALVLRARSDGRRERALVDDWPAPPPIGPRDVRCQTLYTGVTNGTDANRLMGGNYAPLDAELPSPWGYQNVGRVVEIGRDVSKLKVDDLVFMSADHVDQVVIAEDGLLIRLPDDIEPREAALFGMGGVAMRACRAAGARPGKRVLVVGAGCVGLIASQILSAKAADTVICDICSDRLAVARQLGAAGNVVDVSGSGWSGSIPSEGFDAVIDFAGAKGSEDSLIAALRPLGCVVLIAGRSRVEYTFNLGQRREVTVRQTSHFDRDDLGSLCELVRRRAVSIGALIRDVVPITQAGAVYDTLRDSPGKLLGTVFVW